MGSVIILTSITKLTANVANSKFQTKFIEDAAIITYSLPINLIGNALEKAITLLGKLKGKHLGDETYYGYFIPDFIDQIGQLFYYAKENFLNLDIEAYLNDFNTALDAVNRGNPTGEPLATWDEGYIQYLANQSKLLNPENNIHNLQDFLKQLISNTESFSNDITKNMINHLEGWLSAMLGIDHPDYPEDSDGPKLRKAWTNIIQQGGYSKLHSSVITITPIQVIWNLQLRSAADSKFSLQELTSILDSIFEGLENAWSYSYIDENQIMLTYIGYI